jgi:hypothetical protein
MRLKPSLPMSFTRSYILTHQRVVHNYRYKKGKMNLEEIKKFLSLQASFVGHIKHANSYNLMNKVGKIDESNPFDFDRS